MKAPSASRSRPSGCANAFVCVRRARRPSAPSLVLQAEVPVHAGAGLVEEGLGRERGEEAEPRGDLAREALEAEHRVGLRQRLAGHEVDFVLRVRRLVRVAADRDALQVAGGEQRVEVVGEVAGAFERVGLAGALARGRAVARRGRVQARPGRPTSRRSTRNSSSSGATVAGEAGRVQPRQHAAQRGARRQLARADRAAVALGVQRARPARRSPRRCPCGPAAGTASRGRARG